ncbi:hypothetical protein AB1I63_08740 [Streptococcus pneumoniae]
MAKLTEGQWIEKGLGQGKELTDNPLEPVFTAQQLYSGLIFRYSSLLFLEIQSVFLQKKRLDYRKISSRLEDFAYEYRF